MPSFVALVRTALGLILPFTLVAGCGHKSAGALTVTLIGSPALLSEKPPRLDPMAGLVRAATTEGLVGLDNAGRITPALADRWIITDDGKSYIFRLRDGIWPDGSPITAVSARASLRRALAALRGSALGLDLAGIDDVRAMAGRVIELRLGSPNPDLLQLLAQPELGLTYKGRGAGPMRLKHVNATTALEPIPPRERGLPDVENWSQSVRPLEIKAMPAEAAVASFDRGKSDVVLGGRIGQFPLTSAAGLSRGTIQLDPVIGLFGLIFVHDDGFLGPVENREAIAMAIDRAGLLTRFGVGGWSGTTRVVAPGLDGDPGTVGERWTALSLEQRRAAALARVRHWQAAHPVLSPLRIALPEGAGGKLLLEALQGDLAAVGLAAVQVGENDPADLRLVDQVARYARATWFLNQLSCAARLGLCSSAADALSAEARTAPDAASRAALLAQAETQLTAANVYVPFGPPVRWSLVRGDVSGFAPNAWGIHPLMALATRSR